MLLFMFHNNIEGTLKQVNMVYMPYTAISKLIFQHVDKQQSTHLSDRRGYLFSMISYQEYINLLQGGSANSLNPGRFE